MGAASGGEDDCCECGYENSVRDPEKFVEVQVFSSLKGRKVEKKVPGVENIAGLRRGGVGRGGTS